MAESTIRRVKIQGEISSENSTTTPLAAGVTWEGDSISVLDEGIIYINVFSDVASAEDGLKLMSKIEGSSVWREADTYTVPADTLKTFSFQASSGAVRVEYTNGGAGQSVFELETIIKGNSKPSSHRIQDAITSDDDAELVKSVLTGEDPNGDFVNFRSTRNGNFRVAVEEYGDTPSIDAFDRLRVSETFTLQDSKQLHDKQPLFWDEVLGGNATSVHVPVDASTKMSVTANASDYVIRQTKQRPNYQPGKSQLILLTFRSPQVAGLTKRIGVFDGTGANYLTPNNGIFFECDGDISWNIAKDGTTAETVTQDDWNYDKLDGTGVSKITLDMSATQIAIIDYEWLGVGRVRVGFVIDGLIRYCHYFNHANDPTFESVYMSTPNLPIRYDIQTDGTAGGSLDHICSTIMSEGGLDKTGILRSVENNDAFVNSHNNGTKYGSVGIRLKSDYRDITVIPEEVSVVIGTNDSFKWELQLNPVINGTFTYNDLDDSSVQYAQGTTSNTIATDGLVVGRGGGSTQTRASTSELRTALRIGTTIAGDSDELVLVFQPLSANVSMWCDLNFRELL